MGDFSQLCPPPPPHRAVGATQPQRSRARDHDRFGGWTAGCPRRGRPGLRVATVPSARGRGRADRLGRGASEGFGGRQGTGHGRDTPRSSGSRDNRNGRGPPPRQPPDAAACGWPCRAIAGLGRAHVGPARRTRMRPNLTEARRVVPSPGPNNSSATRQARRRGSSGRRRLAAAASFTLRRRRPGQGHVDPGPIGPAEPAAAAGTIRAGAIAAMCWGRTGRLSCRFEPPTPAPEPSLFRQPFPPASLPHTPFAPSGATRRPHSVHPWGVLRR